MSELVPIAYIARGVDKDSVDPWVADDEYDGYVPVEPYAYRPRPGAKRWSVHPHEMPLPDDWESWRTIEKFRCDCPQGRTLARTLAGTDGVVWALIQPERIPRAVQRPGHMTDDELAVPLHSDPNGTPCMQLTSCKRCGRRWLVLIFEDTVDLVKVDLVRHNLRVSE